MHSILGDEFWLLPLFLTFNRKEDYYVEKLYYSIFLIVKFIIKNPMFILEWNSHI